VGILFLLLHTYHYPFFSISRPQNGVSQDSVCRFQFDRAIGSGQRFPSHAFVQPGFRNRQVEQRVDRRSACVLILHGVGQGFQYRTTIQRLVGGHCFLFQADVSHVSPTQPEAVGQVFQEGHIVGQNRIIRKPSSQRCRDCRGKAPTRCDWGGFRLFQEGAGPICRPADEN